MHNFYLKYPRTPKSWNMLGNSLPVGPARQRTESPKIFPASAIEECDMRFFRRVPPCAVKTCAVRPVFAHVVGELQVADPSSWPGGHNRALC